MENMDDKVVKKILILGAGFGGLQAAMRIAKKLARLGLEKKYEVLLIDRNSYHTFTPLLYEVATTSMATATATKLRELTAYEISPLLQSAHVKFMRSEVINLDLIEGDIHLAGGERLNADFIVLALGAEINYFGIAGLKGSSLPLKTFADALHIRDAISKMAGEGAADIRIVVGGGGPTGVELAGELRAWCGELSEEFPRCRLQLKLIEANPKILSGFEDKTVASAEKRLARLGVEIITNARISGVEGKKLSLEDKRTVPFDFLIWSGGIKAPDMLSRLPVEAEQRGRIVVAQGMECIPQTPTLKLSSKIYALGDAVCFYDPATNKPIPAVAPAAVEEAKVIAHNIVEEIRAAEVAGYRSEIKNYQPRRYPYIIPIGGKWAVAKLGPFVFSGFPGWIFKGVVELNYLFSIMPFGNALKIWLKGLKIFIQNDRLG